MSAIEAIENEEGYAKVSKLFSTHSELAIFRRFRALNMMNLLYLQAEIIHLEAELQVLVKEDMKHSERQNNPYDWWSLSQEGNTKQWEKILEIREKLEKYNRVILEQTAIFQLRGPTDHDLNFLKDWFQRTTLGSFPLYGRDREYWNVDNEKELLALWQRRPSDPFASWFTHTLVPYLHKTLFFRFRKDKPSPLGSVISIYSDTYIALVERLVSIVAASFLPLLSVVVLFVTRDNTLRLGAIVLLSALFGIAIALMTDARNIEILAATAAFAAVNVVYLTNGAPAPEA